MEKDNITCSTIYFLIDGSIKNNIAFGIDEKHIDFKRIIEVANIAQISDFIKSTKYGYDTVVGEGVSILVEAKDNALD